MRIADSARVAYSTGPCVGPILLYMEWNEFMPGSDASSREYHGEDSDCCSHVWGALTSGARILAPNDFRH